MGVSTVARPLAAPRQEQKPSPKHWHFFLLSGGRAHLTPRCPDSHPPETDLTAHPRGGLEEVDQYERRRREAPWCEWCLRGNVPASMRGQMTQVHRVRTKVRLLRLERAQRWLRNSAMVIERAEAELSGPHRLSAADRKERRAWLRDARWLRESAIQTDRALQDWLGRVRRSEARIICPRTGATVGTGTRLSTEQVFAVATLATTLDKIAPSRGFLCGRCGGRHWWEWEDLIWGRGTRMLSAAERAAEAAEVEAELEAVVA